LNDKIILDGYLDVDMVNLIDDDFTIAANIRNLSDTTWDKLAFTIFTVNIVMTGFLAGFVPQYYYIVYTFKAVLLIGYRWYSYKKTRNHYYLFDFCYFTNALVLLYLWLPFLDTIRGLLFPVIFGFCNGPLLAAVALWRNSIVPHSIDKMTSAFIHISPAIAMWGLKWYSTPDQGFPLCMNPTAPGSHGCNHGSTMEIILPPTILYLFWQIGYIVVVFFWRKERIEMGDYETSYKRMVEKTKEGFLYHLCGVCGPRCRKHLYVIYQFIYTMGSVLLAYPCFHYLYANMLLVVAVLFVASYNGASFYIDVFSRRYHSDMNNKKKEK
jgi:hypothetical protein